MKKTTSVVTAMMFLLAGIVIGFLISPVKKGVGNNSGNTKNYYYRRKDEPSNP